jgi:RHS repeat-associated protein
MRAVVRFVSCLITLLAVAPRAVSAQPQGPPELAIVTPAASSTRHALNPKIAVEYVMGGQCLDDGSGDCNPDPATLLIRVNGINRTGSFTVTEWNAQNGTGNAGNVNLNNGQWNTIYARICNVFDCAEQTISVFIQAGPQQQLLISPMHPSVHQPAACEAVSVAPGAALACDALVIAHAIPGYVSLGALRSAGVVYSSRSALAQVTVPANVQLVWDAAATKVDAHLAGGDTTYWNGPDWDGTSGTVTRRIALSRAENVATAGYVGRQFVTLQARVHTAAGLYVSSVTDTLPHYFERDSLTTPIARGWGIAGLARLYAAAGHMPGGTPHDSMDVLLVQAGGAVAFYKYLSKNGDVVTYGRPEGTFATLTKSSTATRWTLLSMDGAQQYYTWVTALGYARLDSLVTPAGTTRIAYRGGGSGAPATITDPGGAQVQFHYHGTASGVGALDSICAPAGANQRCTRFAYGASGGNPVLSTITDPDGIATSFGYAGSPHWSAVTSITPRGLGTYAIAYHSAVARPSGVVQPGSSDTVKYLAPQLAGAALVGGTSANPATPANADSAWGWVRPPLGPTRHFTADRFGLVLLSKSPDNRLSKVVRNSAGQPTWMWHAVGGNLVAWAYNTMGALSTIQITGGSPTTVTYSGACASGTGYPCLPAQVVVQRTPLPPDTTKWYYTNGLVDSVYRSAGPALRDSGITRMWYGANARVDSVYDPQGHRTRFQYEGTWGNVLTAISDSILGKCAIRVCRQTLDTTTFTYDVTGRVQSTRRGGSGRAVTVFRDRIARDTMVVDTAAGGGSAVTTRSRFTDTTRTVTVIDGRGQSVVSLFDVRGRLIRQTDPAGARDSLAYDANDRVTSWTTRRDQTMTYAYDAVGRLRTKTVPNDTVPNDETWTYGYHGSYGTLDTLTTPSASIYRSHNVLGWLLSEKTVVNGVTRTVSYRHDGNGVVDTLVDPWGQYYRYGWDGANRARTITNPFSESFSLRHSAEGLLSQVVFPTGTDVIGYDASHLPQSAGLSGEVTYTRDSVTKGFASIRLGGGMTQTFTYDGFGRLASEAHDSATATYGPAAESYGYDAAGNRTGAGGTFTVDLRNALRGRPTGVPEANPGDTLSYDAAGNPTWWRNKTTGWYDSLSWDAEDRLVRLRRYNASHQLQLDVNFAYDGFGRRVRKWGTGVSTTLYVWNGWELLAETDASGNATRRYTHAPEGLDFPLAMRQSNTTSLFHLDGQGNVYLLTDLNGTRRSEYRYRGYGDRYVTPVGEAVASPFGYKGREEDRETGLVYLRHRYYSPRLERFVNQDPIGIAGGLNTYGFAGLSPVNASDPMGLCSKWIYRTSDGHQWEEYDWACMDAVMRALGQFVNMQFAGWTALGGLGMPGGLNPFDGGTAGTGTVGGTGGHGSGDGESGDADGTSDESVSECMARNLAAIGVAASAAGAVVGANGAILAARGRLLYQQAIEAWGPVKHITRILAFPGGELIGTRLVGQTAGTGLMSLGGALVKAGLVGIAFGASYIGTTAAACAVGAL